MPKYNKLPEHVTKLSEKEQADWLSAYDTAYEGCVEEDDSDTNCEEAAADAADAALEDGDDMKFVWDKGDITVESSKKAADDDEDDGPDMKAMFQKIHDNSLKLGAKCGESDSKAGAAAQQIHDDTVTAGAKCAAEKKATSHEDFPAVTSTWISMFGDTTHTFKAIGPYHLTAQNPITKTVYEYPYSYAVDDDQREVISFEEPAITHDPEFNNCLKAIRQDDERLIVANYIVLFEGRDLEGIATKRINRDGSRGEFFTKATVFESDYTDTGQLIVDWEHRTRPDPEGPDHEDILGYVDWKTAQFDDRGVFVERVLNRRNKYVKMLEHLIAANLIGTSSEPVQKSVKKAANGAIEVWPLRRDTLTVQPMDPRMLDSNTLSLLKALQSDLSPTDPSIQAKAKAEAELFLIELGEE